MEHNELLLGLVPIVDKGQELIPHKDYEIKQDGKKFYLVKKKKEYPKTFENCLEILGYNIAHTIPMNHGHNGLLMMNLQRLLICRDAYWKIAGEEMGLGKPWKPQEGVIYCYMPGAPSYIRNIFPFPTEEMRDAFYENFKEDIEFCKEFL